MFLDDEARRAMLVRWRCSEAGLECSSSTEGRVSKHFKRVYVKMKTPGQIPAINQKPILESAAKVTSDRRQAYVLCHTGWLLAGDGHTLCSKIIFKTLVIRQWGLRQWRNCNEALLHYPSGTCYGLDSRWQRVRWKDSHRFWCEQMVLAIWGNWVNLGS